MRACALVAVVTPHGKGVTMRKGRKRNANSAKAGSESKWSWADVRANDEPEAVAAPSTPQLTQDSESTADAMTAEGDETASAITPLAGMWKCIPAGQLSPTPAMMSAVLDIDDQIRGNLYELRRSRLRRPMPCAHDPSRPRAGSRGKSACHMGA
jgi:hypothetical protein